MFRMSFFKRQAGDAEIAAVRAKAPAPSIFDAIAESRVQLDREVATPRAASFDTAEQSSQGACCGTAGYAFTSMMTFH